MSEGRQYLVRNDGSNVLFDPTSGKYFTVVNDNYQYGNTYYHLQTINVAKYHDANVVPVHYVERNKYENIRQPRFYSNGSLHQQSSKSNHTKTSQHPNVEKKQANTCQNNASNNIPTHTKPTDVLNDIQRDNGIEEPSSTEQSNTPHEIEQIQALSINDVRNDESHQNYCSHQESLAVANKRTLNDSDDFTKVGSNKTERKIQNKRKKQDSQVQSNNTQLNTRYINDTNNTATNYIRSNSNENNHLPITKFALEYASTYHFSPFKMDCQPKVRDRKEGTKIINELIKYITSDFLSQNRRFFSRHCIRSLVD